MNSRQRIKALKIYGIYDRRGKKYNDKPLIYYFAKGENLRQITSLWYDSEKSLKKLRSGHRLKVKKIIHITN